MNFVAKISLEDRIETSTAWSNLPVTCLVPDTNSSILRTSDYVGKLGMNTNGSNIICMAFQNLDTTFGFIVPYLFLNMINQVNIFKQFRPFEEITTRYISEFLVANLSSAIIRTTDQKHFIVTGADEVFNAVDPFRMCIQCKIWRSRIHIPYLKLDIINKEIQKEHLTMSAID